MRSWLVFLLVVLLVASCGGDDDGVAADGGAGDAPQACPKTRPTACNPLSQSGCAAGEKCTWLVEALMPQLVGQLGCAPVGTGDVGDPCTFGLAGCDGFDTCKQGLVCSDYNGAGGGTCKRICDQQGGLPQCDGQHACVVYDGLFDNGDSTPASAGVCDRTCDPLADNDYDGSGAATRPGAACGNDPLVGCYGFPSLGTPPQTTWTCQPDVSGNRNLRHRTTCTTDNGCAGPGPTIYVNSCSQGYLPFLRQSSTISTTICAALCKPKNCYMSNCGTNNENRLGEAPHRCNGIDRVGTFDTSAAGEHCRYLWYYERYGGQLLRSPSSDTLGICVDHGKYGQAACASLPLQQAAQLGCVDSVTAGM